MLLVASQFRKIGEALYGRNWRAPMAAKLRKAKRTIERYATSQRTLPANVSAELDSIIDEQIARLSKLMSVERDQG